MLRVDEIEANMQVETVAKMECGWCCEVKSTHVDMGERNKYERAAERLAQSFTYAQDDDTIGFACTQCMASGTLKEVKDATE